MNDILLLLAYDRVLEKTNEKQDVDVQKSGQFYRLVLAQPKYINQ